jgi:nitrite reductase/ring-hydroxylating ferredoxin subunit/uncharacterized membrane protein
VARTGIIDQVEQAEGLDGTVGQVREVARRWVRSDPLRRLLSGTDLGHPAHPALVQLPIGFWTSAWVMDFTGLSKTKMARRFVGLGVLTALPTIASGLSDWIDTEDGQARVGLVHATFNASAVACFSLSWWRRRGGRHGGIFWSLLGGTLATAGGFLGGHLAYSMGVGVDTNAFEVGPEEWTAARGGVPTESLSARTVGGVRVMVAETEQGRFALADRCSHRGGPLSDGTLDDGCVTCPWHGSRFDVETGIPTRGPASIPQPTYETRVTDNKLELRRQR